MVIAVDDDEGVDEVGVASCNRRNTRSTKCAGLGQQTPIASPG